MLFVDILAMAVQQGGGPGSGYPFNNAEAAAVVARMSAPPDDTRKAVIDTLVGGLKSGATSGTNIWSKIDVLYVHAAHSSQAALLEWKGNTAYDAVANGSAAFTTDRGWIGTSTGDYLQSSYAPGTSSLGMTNADCHYGAFAQTGSATNANDMGQSATSWALKTADGFAAARIAGSSLVNPSAGSGPHHIAASRSSSTSAFAYRNGVAGAEQTVSNTTALSTVALVLLAATAASAPSGRRFSAFHVGKALTAAEHLDIFNALQAYNTAVGA